MKLSIKLIPLLIFLLFWFIYGLTPNKVFILQGAVLEQLVERGTLSFTDGKIDESSAFLNFETQTEQFKKIPYNMFEYNKRIYVNHSPGQFLLGWPVYRLCTLIGINFSENYQQVWKILRWLLIAPLGAMAVASIFLIAFKLNTSKFLGLIISAVFGLGTPWWIVATHYYHDMFGTALLLIGSATYFIGKEYFGAKKNILLGLTGFCLGAAIFMTYLLIPIALFLTVLFTLRLTQTKERMVLLGVFVAIASLLPITNYSLFGSFVATGYSLSGLKANYPSLLDWPNLIEKLYFYLFSPLYGLWVMFPGLLLSCFLYFQKEKSPKSTSGTAIRGRPRVLIVSMLLIHIVYIASMREHGSVLWGMGRFFIPGFVLACLLIPNVFENSTKQFSVFNMFLTALFIIGIIHSAMIVSIDLHPGNMSFIPLAYKKFGHLFLGTPTIAIILAGIIHFGLLRKGAQKKIRRVSR